MRARSPRQTPDALVRHARRPQSGVIPAVQARRPVPKLALVVDDSPDLRDLMATILAASGARVVSVPDARAALAVLRSIQFDVVVTDYAMPGGDGLALLAELRAHPGYSDVTALLVSANDDRDQLAREATRHRAAFLAKPFDAGELAALARVRVA